MKKPRQSSVVDNRHTSTSYDNDVASGSRNYDDDDDDDDDNDYDDEQSPNELTGSHDEFDENYANIGNKTKRKRRGTKMMMIF